MQRIQISTKHAPAAIGPYSQAIRCGQFIFASGQAALDPTSGELVGCKQCSLVRELHLPMW